jgi:hypothetical protein
MRIPKHRELLRLFIGQPIIMTFIIGVLGLLLFSVYGVVLSCYQAWQIHGSAQFLPSKNAGFGLGLLGLGLAIFNIACDSVEIDFNQTRTGPSLPTAALATLSCLLWVGAIDYFVRSTGWFDISRFRESGATFVTGILIMTALVLLLRSHRRSFKRTTP